MMKKFFPMFVDLSEKNIVVIGGGTIASRRIKTLTEFADNIVVVAPAITESLDLFVADGKITWRKEEYETTHLKSADMVIAATNQPHVNRRIWEDVRELEIKENRRIMINVVDDKSSCDFYFPGIVQKEDMIIGISSGGTSPEKSKQLRKNMERMLESESIY